MKQSSTQAPRSRQGRRGGSSTSLQADLLTRIQALACAEQLGPGARLNENELARRLGVSRTPIRAALTRLAERGIVVRLPHRGVEILRALPRARPSRREPGLGDADALLRRIAHDRRAGRLADDISEAELMRHFDCPRPLVLRTLDRLAELGLVIRKRGYGWRFQPAIRDDEMRDESYRLRLLLEPDTILEPGFALAPAWTSEMIARHETAMTAPWRQGSSVAFFEMNAAFHEGIAFGARNRFILDAVRRQNQLRQFSNYDWGFGHERVLVSCREHRAILRQLAAGDLEIAAILMRRHLEGAAALKRQSGTLA